MNKAAELIAIMFLGRELAHREHLKVSGPGSYAQHVALNEFYEGIVDLADKFAETHQGKYGIIEDIPLAENEFTGNCVEVLEAQVNWIDENRDDICDYRPLQNIVDEICGFYWAKLYKLKNLA